MSHLITMSRSVHDFPTCPLLLLLRHRGDMKKGVRALVEGSTLDTDTFLDSGYDFEAGDRILAKAFTLQLCGSSSALSMMLSLSKPIFPWLHC